MYGIQPQIVLIKPWHLYLGFLQPMQVWRVNGHVIQWKNLPFESVFQLWGLFDTPKNRVVTSDVIWLLPSESCSTSHREPLDTAQTEE